MRKIFIILVCMISIGTNSIFVQANYESHVAVLRNNSVAIIEIEGNVISSLKTRLVFEQETEEERLNVLKNNILLYEEAVINNDNVYWNEGFVENVIKLVFPEIYERVKNQKDNNDLAMIEIEADEVILNYNPLRRAAIYKSFTKEFTYTQAIGSGGFMACKTKFSWDADQTTRDMQIYDIILSQGSPDSVPTGGIAKTIYENGSPNARFSATFHGSQDLILLGATVVALSVRPSYYGTFTYDVTFVGNE